MPLAFGEGNPVFNQAGRARLESEYCHVKDSAISTLVSVDIAEYPPKNMVCVCVSGEVALLTIIIHTVQAPCSF